MDQVLEPNRDTGKWKKRQMEQMGVNTGRKIG